jgi:eukaryotic-like serine/threonine-protein kinase
MSLTPGSRLGPYEIVAALGAGGMGEVYRALDARLSREVAIKVLPQDISGDLARRHRFEHEARTAGSLCHPNLLTVFDVGAENDAYYLVTELVDGESLRGVMRNGPLSARRIAEIGAQIAEGLAVAHAAGVVHRDLKPENIMVDEHDNVKLIDFGIAGDSGARRLTYANLTSTLGTADYISPEQVKGKRGDGRSDIYSMGVILYEMLTGRLPFSGSSPMEVMNDRLLNHPVPPTISDPRISPQMQEVLYRALERDPQNRYAHAREFAYDLQHLDQVGVEDRVETRNWSKRKSRTSRQVAYYAALALIPVVILLLMVLVSRHR